MKEITAEYPDWEELLNEVVQILRKNGAKIENEENFKKCIQSIGVDEKDELVIHFKHDALTVGGIMGVSDD